MASASKTPEEIIRQLTEQLEAERREKERRTEDAERRAEDAERRAEEERRRAEDAERRAEEEKRRADEETGRAEEEKRRADEETGRAEEGERRAEELERNTRNSQFLDYVRHTEAAIFSAFLFEQSPSRAASGAGTDVSGKMYPRFLRPWPGFAERHMASFNLLCDSLDGQALFLSPNSVEDLRNSIIRRGSIADEMDVRPFIAIAIEEPAAAVVEAHLNVERPDKVRCIRFTNNAYGRVSRGEPATKKSSPTKDLMPDRWTFLVENSEETADEKWTNILVGEYKPPRKLKAATLERVMESQPGDTFFKEAIQTGEKAASQALVPGHVLVAQALCQIYHYMIGARCEYGYIASGDSLVMLRVLEDAADTLYYHSVRFAVPAIPDAEERRRRTVGLRAAHETAVAYIATLCLWAAETTPRPESWSDEIKAVSLRWPTKTERKISNLSMPYRRGNDGSGGGGGGGSSGDGDSTGGSGDGNTVGPPGSSRLPMPSNPLKRGRSPTRQPPRNSENAEMMATPPANASQTTELEKSETPKATRFASRVAQFPTLPFCTQACLRGLARGLALDNSCPNVALHRAAREQNGRDATTSTEKRTELSDGHPLTSVTLQSRVVAQIAANRNKDMECLDKYGYYGRYGVLYKIAVTGYGYVFLGKSVTEGNRHVLDAEATVYEAIPHLQGRLVPVFLGVVRLERPISYLFDEETDMLLLSFAGPSLDNRIARPRDVDWESEMDRTTWELEKAGIYNDDVRECNAAWNAEVGRVMHFDFDQAEVYPPTLEPAAAQEVEPKVEPTTTTTPVKMAALEARTPLLEKPDGNAHHPSKVTDDEEGDGRAAKRMRTDRFMEMARGAD